MTSKNHALSLFQKIFQKSVIERLKKINLIILDHG